MTLRGGGGQKLGLSAFGLSLLTDLAPPGAWRAQPLNGGPTLRVRASTPRVIAESWSGPREVGWEGTIDGAPFVVERGVAGDHRFVHGTIPDPTQREEAIERYAHIRAIHHLSPDARLLLCAPSNLAEPSWWRVVLDSALFTVALLRGYEALHAGAVATPEGAIAIAATTGGGKSTLLTELLRHDLRLMADDVLVLEPSRAGARPGGTPLAHPAPPLMTVPAARLSALSELSTSAPVASSQSIASPQPVAPLQPIVAPPQPIASLGDERWIAVPVHPEPLPLQAVVVLNRRPGLITGLHRTDKPLTALLGSLMRFPRTRERERARFEMAGAIAAHVPVWRLDADPGVDPGVLAELLLAVVGETYVRGQSNRC